MEKIFALLKDNIVINVVVFDESATQELIDEITNTNNAEVAIDTSNYEDVGINYTWHQDHFKPPKPFASWIWSNEKWTAPISKPIDAIYVWNEGSQNWEFVKNLPTPEEL